MGQIWRRDGRGRRRMRKRSRPASGADPPATRWPFEATESPSEWNFDLHPSFLTFLNKGEEEEVANPQKRRRKTCSPKEVWDISKGFLNGQKEEGLAKNLGREERQEAFARFFSAVYGVETEMVLASLRTPPDKDQWFVSMSFIQDDERSTKSQTNCVVTNEPILENFLVNVETRDGKRHRTKNPWLIGLFLGPFASKKLATTIRQKWTNESRKPPGRFDYGLKLFETLRHDHPELKKVICYPPQIPEKKK